MVSVLMVAALQVIDKRFCRKGEERPAGVANIPFRSLLGPALYLSVIIFNLSIAFIIGERLMAVAGIYVFTLPVVIVAVLVVQRTNRYAREELAAHLRDFPWSAAAGARRD